MEITITGRNCGITDRFRSYATEKADKIASFADRSLALEVKVSRHHEKNGAPVGDDRVELTLIGPRSEHWDLAFIAEYPSGAAFIEMLRDPVYREAVKHRQAAVEDSRLIRMQPGKPGTAFGEQD